MPKIKEAKPKNISGGYQRLFGIPRLGMLMSKVQSTVISAGSELERIIYSEVKTIDDLDTFLHQTVMPDGVFLVAKREFKRCKRLDFSGSRPDFIIFKRRRNRQRCHIVELKDGHVFDTKKADSERRAIYSFVKRNRESLQDYVISTHFCAFNQSDPQVIWEGFKKKINYEEAMTGREFCELLEIDYDAIVEMRQQDTEENVMYFVTELLKIKQVRQIIENILQ